jgi:hypothetical protein
MHTGMVYPPFKIFTKLADKNAIKPEKGVPSQNNFHSPYIPSTSEICHKRHRPSPWIFKQCASMDEDQSIVFFSLLFSLMFNISL